MEKTTPEKAYIILDQSLKDKCIAFLSFRNLSEKTKELYSSVINDLFKQEVLSQKVFDKYNSKGASYKAVLKVILNTCEHYSIPSYNYKVIKSIQKRPKKPIRMSEEDIINLSHKIEDYGLLIRCAYYIGGGLRFSSAILLKWEDFLWKEWINDPDSVGKCDILAKGNKEDFLDVDPILMKELYEKAKKEERLFQGIPYLNYGGSPYLFIDSSELDKAIEQVKKQRFEEMLRLNGESLPKMDIDKRAKNIIIKKMHDRVNYKLRKLKDSSNKKIKFHAIRHNKAMNLLKEGFKLAEIKEMLMHKSILTTQIYINPDKQEITKKYSEMVKKREANYQ